MEVVAREGVSGLDNETWRRFPLDAPLPLSDAIRERHAVVLETLADRDARYPSLVGAGFMFDHAMACIPMLTGGHAVGGVVVSFADARTFAEDELTFLVALAAQGAVASERARLRQAEHAQRERSAFVAAAGQLLAASLDDERTLAEVTHLAVHGVVIEGEELAGPADWCAIDLLEEDGSIRLLAVEHRDPKKVELARDLRRRIPPSVEDPTGVGAVIRTGQPEVTTEASDALIAAAVEDPHVRQVLLDLRLTSAIVVPLISRSRVLGALSLVASGSGRHDGAEDMDLAQDIARLAAAAIDNARL